MKWPFNRKKESKRGSMIVAPKSISTIGLSRRQIEGLFNRIVSRYSEEFYRRFGKERAALKFEGPFISDDEIKCIMVIDVDQPEMNEEEMQETGRIWRKIRDQELMRAYQ